MDDLPEKADAATVEVTNTEAKAKPAATKLGRPAKTKIKPRSTSIYLHPAVKEALRDICYHERKKEHDLYLEGLELVLKKRAYPTIAQLITRAEQE